jgi:hypothetical protein
VKLSALFAVGGALLCCGRTWGKEPTCEQRLAVVEQIDREAAAYRKAGHAAAACKRLRAADRELVRIEAKKACESDFKFKDFPSDDLSFRRAVIHQSVMAIPCRPHGCEIVQQTGPSEHLADFLTDADYAFYESACHVTETTNPKKTPQH